MGVEVAEAANMTLSFKLLPSCSWYYGDCNSFMLTKITCGVISNIALFILCRDYMWGFSQNYTSWHFVGIFLRFAKNAFKNQETSQK